MAKKGVRASLEPICFRLYGQGWTLSAMSARFEVSVTTLSKWKKESLSPGQPMDDWDLKRQSNIDDGETLRQLFNEQKSYVLGLQVSQRDTRIFDALSKAGANYRHWEKHERDAAAALLAEMTTAESSEGADIDRPAIFLETLEWIALKLKETDPEGLKVLARNFDTLVIQFKSENAKEQ